MSDDTHDASVRLRWARLRFSIVSQLLTVYTTPVVYLYVHRYWKNLKQGKYNSPPASAGGQNPSGGGFAPLGAGT